MECVTAFIVILKANDGLFGHCTARYIRLWAGRLPIQRHTVPQQGGVIECDMVAVPGVTLPAVGDGFLGMVRAHNDDASGQRCQEERHNASDHGWSPDVRV